VIDAVFAHGVGVRGDLPLERWMVAWAVAVAVAASFAGLSLLWHRPQLARRSDGRSLNASRRMSVVMAPILGVISLLLLATALASGLFGAQTSGNWAPYGIYIGFWVGLQLLSAIVGNLWGEYGPFATLAQLFDRIRPAPQRAWDHWPAAAGIGVFAWLELAYHDPGAPRTVGAFALAHTVAATIGCWRFGRGWARDGEPFAALFGLFGHLAPIGRAASGGWAVRLPFVGLARMTPRSGTAALVLVTLGSTTFDGVARTGWWGDLVEGRRGWSLTLVTTIGLLVTVGVVAILYLVSVRLMAQLTGGDELALRNDFLPSLVPIALAYSIAHYFSLLVLEGQLVWYRLSDPLDRGWDLFGAADNRVDFLAVSTTTIAWVQAGAIAVGHVIGVMVAHDRSIERFPSGTAFRSQLPLLVAMIAYSVAGLFLLLNA
jgi:hypothetical protein